MNPIRIRILLFLSIATAVIVFFAFRFTKNLIPESLPAAVSELTASDAIEEKSVEELIREARERSENIKGVYMTTTVANDPGRAATRLRNDVIELLETTELNGVVIDIKETDGIFLPESLRSLIQKFHQKGIWVIARLVVFNDTVKAKASPELALKRADGRLWLDQRGNAWLDPASQGAWEYTAAVAKQAINYGFDEIQFDYIRFPSDGDTSNIVYPTFDQKTKKRHEVLRDFFQYLKHELKTEKPQIILSADLFGYVAIQKSDLGIGQRLEDLGDSFDYISFMTYPSHYYSGFQVPADAERGLPALYYPYRAEVAENVVSSHPYEVVYRSLVIASDFLAGKDVFATSAPATILAENTSAVSGKEPPIINKANTKKKSETKLRPWIQDFDLKVDTVRGIYYDAEKVRQQIRAAEDARASGWLLWNPGNTYTEGALKKE